MRISVKDFPELCLESFNPPMKSLRKLLKKKTTFRTVSYYALFKGRRGLVEFGRKRMLPTVFEDPKDVGKCPKGVPKSSNEDEDDDPLNTTFLEDPESPYEPARIRKKRSLPKPEGSSDRMDTPDPRKRRRFTPIWIKDQGSPGSHGANNSGKFIAPITSSKEDEDQNDPPDTTVGYELMSKDGPVEDWRMQTRSMTKSNGSAKKI